MTSILKYQRNSISLNLNYKIFFGKKQLVLLLVLQSLLQSLIFYRLTRLQYRQDKMILISFYRSILIVNPHGMHENSTKIILLHCSEWTTPTDTNV